MTYTIHNAVILTLDDNNTFYPYGAMVIKDGKIAAVGKKDTITFEGEIIDMHGNIVMPGLVNAHTHSHSSVLRNLADDKKLMDWLKTGIWPLEAVTNADVAKAAMGLTCLEFIKTGVTTFLDEFFFAKDIAPVSSSSGLRCFLSATVFENDCVETEDTLSAAEDFVKNWIGKEDETLIYPCFGPHAPYSVSAAQFKKIAELSEKYGVLINVHVSESPDEGKQIYEKYGCTPTEWLESLGVFSQRTVAAHSVHMSEHDLEIYAKNNVGVAYNPVSNLKLVSGIMPLKKMYEHGITVAIGTDGAQSNNSMDLLQDIKIGTLIQKQYTDDATFFNAEQCVRMLTVNGAKVLGMEDKIGTLEVGKYADFISLDTTSVNLTPLHKNRLSNIYSAIAYSVVGSDVADTVVNGKWLMKDRHVLSLDSEEIRKNAQKASEYLIEHAW